MSNLLPRVGATRQNRPKTLLVTRPDGTKYRQKAPPAWVQPRDMAGMVRKALAGKAGNYRPRRWTRNDRARAYAAKVEARVNKRIEETAQKKTGLHGHHHSHESAGAGGLYEHWHVHRHKEEQSNDTPHNHRHRRETK